MTWATGCLFAGLRRPRSPEVQRQHGGPECIHAITSNAKERPGGCYGLISGGHAGCCGGEDEDLRIIRKSSVKYDCQSCQLYYIDQCRNKPCRKYKIFIVFSPCFKLVAREYPSFGELQEQTMHGLMKLNQFW